MGKKARTRRSEQRKKDKRSRKSTQRALYESYKASGQNKKSKRVSLGSARARVVGVRSHPNGACGNHGCEKCSQEYARPRMNALPPR